MDDTDNELALVGMILVGIWGFIVGVAVGWVLFRG